MTLSADAAGIPGKLGARKVLLPTQRPSSVGVIDGRGVWQPNRSKSFIQEALVQRSDLGQLLLQRQHEILGQCGDCRAPRPARDDLEATLTGKNSTPRSF